MWFVKKQILTNIASYCSSGIDSQYVSKIYLPIIMDFKSRVIWWSNPITFEFHVQWHWLRAVCLFFARAQGPKPTTRGERRELQISIENWRNKVSVFQQSRFLYSSPEMYIRRWRSILNQDFQNLWNRMADRKIITRPCLMSPYLSKHIIHTNNCKWDMWNHFLSPVIN